MSKNTQLSNGLFVVVLNWNGWEDTIECMDALLESYLLDATIYLIDNASTDNSWDILRDKYKERSEVEMRRNDINIGYAKAHNLIFNELKMLQNVPEYLILLNNDTVVEKDWLTQLVQFADKSQAGIVGSLLINYYNRHRLDNAGHRMLNTGEILPLDYAGSPDKFKMPMKNIGACAAACLYRWSMLEELGFFDDHFDTGYEDAELGLRAVIAGYDSYMIPSSKVYHKEGRSINKIRDLNYLTTIQSNILYTYFKVLPPTFRLLNAPFFYGRLISILLFDLLFFRRKYLYMHFYAIKQMVFGKYKKAIKAGKIYRAKLNQHGRSAMPAMEIYKWVEFSFWTDWRRLTQEIRINMLKRRHLEAPNK